MESGNWVEQQAREDLLRRNEAPSVWAALRSALQDACDSYNAHYSPEGDPGVEVRIENGKRIVIRLRVTTESSTTSEDLVVRFVADDLAIDFSGSKLRFSSEGDDVFLVTPERRLSVDEASKHILDHFLFRDGRQNPLR
jgi:hypothetical protein